ncbi:chemotaxis protein CheW [Candidatus Aalborgicola defluviihabitans]|jgi:twitching motility protein PilI|uniref:chemotaxis protein CheW n=1 Tax=Candidatus Aalborgicola defluviihabitans TaxID=3386187 RepID=UPI001D9FCD1C|nr:chemotaxis protein CheW [Burkholderiales bacterium]MBK6569684.1 chemotaxis protein CheW [Burkholderiales bacterium]MBK7280046.1 chemotaxis protein CheW [Burkholderiales bacterium]MBL0243047.1 chemotaxis protein CheW [Rhodoferax sp.]
MANREALRELQTRLASRLQAARTEGVSVAWLAVRVGGRNLLFPLGQSGEIFPLSSLQVVPYARDWFRGVLNIRGGLYGVVDLAAFIAIDTGHARAEPAGQEPSVVTLNTALDVNCALQVDGLLGLRGVDAFVSSEPADPDAPAYFGNQFKNSANEQWQEIDLRILSQTPQFLSISA